MQLEKSIEQCVQELARRATAQGVSVATAESCTGGGVCAAITELAGSSAWFDRGFVTYSNQAKQQMLGVQEETLDVHGAVSEAVVKAMVSGALERSGATLAVAVSGIAGPGGGSKEKPVGSVWFAWQRGQGGEIQTQLERFAGDRRAIRRQAVERALRGLVELLG